MNRLLSKSFLFFIGSLVLTLFSDNFSQNSISLKGIPSFQVKISLSEEIPSLSEFELRNDVELKLRQYKIKIDPNTEEQLRVTIFLGKLNSSDDSFLMGYYGTIQLSVSQFVQLQSNSNSIIYTITWESPIQIMHGPTDDFANRCRTFVKDLTDHFINEYLKVNAQ